VTRPRLSNDLELMAVVFFWAFNVTVVKIALREMAPLAFNVLRFAGASLLLLLLTRWLEGSISVARRDLARFVMLGVIGHTLYQLFFIMGLARTTASSTSLIFGSTPIVVGLLSRLAGHEKVGPGQAAGAALGFCGVFLIVQAGGQREALVDAEPLTRLTGNLLVMGAVLCWSLYTVLSKRLLESYSPLRVTAVTLSMGAVMMIPPAIPDLVGQKWGSVSLTTWAGLSYSLIFALVVSYVLWYRSVKQVGNVRTAIYSNLVPVFGTLSGVLLLGERLTAGLGLGGACILAGIALARFRDERAVSSTP
jgi:drug/metabolite transporter (DMT)-like permease